MFFFRNGGTSKDKARDKSASKGNEYVIVEAHLADRQDEWTSSFGKSESAKGRASTQLQKPPQPQQQQQQQLDLVRVLAVESGARRESKQSLLGRVLVHTDVSLL